MPIRPYLRDTTQRNTIERRKTAAEEDLVVQTQR
jgi:hypothetical protein